MSGFSSFREDGLSPRAIGAGVILLAFGVLLTIGLSSAIDKKDDEGAVDVPLIKDRYRSALPDFSGPAGTGKDKATFSSDDMQLPAVLHVYASWCSVCKEEARQFQEAIKESGSKVDTYLIAVDDTPKDALKFAEKHHWDDAIGADDLVIIDDPKRAIESDTLGLGGGQPHTLLVDGKGDVVWVRKGPTSSPELTGAIDAMLAEA